MKICKVIFSLQKDVFGQVNYKIIMRKYKDVFGQINYNNNEKIDITNAKAN